MLGESRRKQALGSDSAMHPEVTGSLETGLELASGKSTSGSWNNVTDWRVLPDPSGGCPAGGAYTSILSGDSQAEQVLSSRTQDINVVFDSPKYPQAMKLRAFYAVPKMVVIPSGSCLGKRKLQASVSKTVSSTEGAFQKTSPPPLIVSQGIESVTRPLLSSTLHRRCA